MSISVAADAWRPATACLFLLQLHMCQGLADLYRLYVPNCTACLPACLSLLQLHMCQGLADLYRQLGRGEDAGRMELELAKHSDEVCGAADVALVKVGIPRYGLAYRGSA